MRKFIKMREDNIMYQRKKRMEDAKKRI